MGHKGPGALGVWLMRLKPSEPGHQPWLWLHDVLPVLWSSNAPVSGKDTLSPVGTWLCPVEGRGTHSRHIMCALSFLGHSGGPRSSIET